MLLICQRMGGLLERRLLTTELWELVHTGQCSLLILRGVNLIFGKNFFAPESARIGVPVPNVPVRYGTVRYGIFARYGVPVHLGT